MSSTAVVDGATSVRNLSAGFNSLESPANRFGVSATVYTQIATTATTGVTAITHTGTGPTMAWTVPVWTFTNATSNTTYTPSWVMGFDAGSSVTFAVADTTGVLTASHAGNATAVNWTVANFNVIGDASVSLDLDIKGGDIKNTTAGAGIDFNPTMAAAGTGTNVVQITTTQPTHASGTPTDIWLDFNPTFGINTVSATANLIDMTFTTPNWATGGATSVWRGLYLAPTIGNASAGTNQVNLIEVAAVTGDASVGLAALAIGALTGTGATENAVTIGAGWDAGISNASPYTSSSTLSAEDLASTDDADVVDALVVGDLTVDEAAGVINFSGATSGTISTSVGTADIVLDSADDAAGSDKTYVSVTGSVPVHASNTPTSIFFDITPTVGIPTVTNTVNLVDLTFTTPIYATGGATSTYRGLYFAPTIGAATNGTNAVALIDVAAITGDDVVSLYGIRAGALTGTAAVEDFISVGAGWDHAIDAASPVKASTFIVDDGSEDVIVDSDNQTATLPTINIPDFVDATADFLVTNTFTTTLPFAGGLRGEDTDGAGTNGGGLVGGAPDITTHTYTNATDDVFVLVYDVGTTTWDALATSALLTAGADWAANWQLLPDADAEEAGDAFAIGFATPFCEVVFDDLATAAGALATWGGNGGKWQYSTGAGTWSDLTVFDNTDVTAYDGLRSLQRTGAITFVPPADWVTATYDGVTKYWVQYVITAAQLTQTPLIDATNKDEPFIAVPNADTFSAPFKMEITKVRVTNMGLTVHDQAIVFIVGNFTDGVFSAAQTWTASQLTDKFTLGTAIAADPGDLIGICITNDTGSTVNPIWAVEFEVTYED
jgi:hypothetical protein